MIEDIMRLVDEAINRDVSIEEVIGWVREEYDKRRGVAYEVLHDTENAYLWNVITQDNDKVDIGYLAMIIARCLIENGYEPNENYNCASDFYDAIEYWLVGSDWFAGKKLI